jgi:hypothetical protein
MAGFPDWVSEREGGGARSGGAEASGLGAGSSSGASSGNSAMKILKLLSTALGDGGHGMCMRGGVLQHDQPIDYHRPGDGFQIHSALRRSGRRGKRKSPAGLRQMLEKSETAVILRNMPTRPDTLRLVSY